MNKKLKGLLATFIFFLLIGSVNALNVSLVDESGSFSNLEYDKTSPNGFFDGFNEDFEKPNNIGSNSFTDNSLVSPNILLDYESDQDLSGEQLEVFYKSFSGDLERAVSTQPAELQESSDEVEVEISAFEALYPGKLYASTSSENAEIENGLLDGDYVVETEVSQKTDSTELEVLEALNSNGEEIHQGLNLSKDLLVSIVRNGTAIAEEQMALHGSREFDAVLEGNDSIYVNNITALEIKQASPCTTLNVSNSYYVMDSSVFNADPHGPGGGENSCLEIEADDIKIDFGDNVIDGDGNFSDTEACGIRIKDSQNVELNNVQVQQFSRGICLENSSVDTVNGRALQENRVGIHSNNSEASISNITSLNSREEYVGFNSSRIDISNSTFDSARVSLNGSDLIVNNASAPENVEGVKNTGNILDIYGTGTLNNLSFIYSVEPEFIYRPEAEEKLASSKEDNRIFLKESITPPSLIGTYNETEDEEEEDTEDGSGGGGGSGGGSGGGGGGALPPGLGSGDNTSDDVSDPERPPWVPANLAPEKVPRVNLSANESISVQQGKSFELPFKIDSIGNVSAVDISVNTSTPIGWRSTESFFNEILPGESSRGQLYVDVFESEVLGSYELHLETSTVINDTFVSLDNETVNVKVEPRGDVRNVKVLEAPFSLNITKGTSSLEGFELRNSGDYRLENVSVKTVGLDKCLDDVRGEWSFDEGVEKEFNYTFIASDTSNSCDGSLIFYSESEDILGVIPAQINVLDIKFSDLKNYLLPWLVLLWTLFTVHRFWRWKNERRRR